MVKIDFTRDYYADLGVSPDATDADIKKQFRKLGMSYFEPLVPISPNY